MVDAQEEWLNNLFYRCYKKTKNQNKTLKTIFDIANKIKRLYTVNV